MTAPMPAPPVRNYSFTNWQTNNPAAPPPGDKLDSNYDLTNSSISQVITWANVSLNTDGTLRDAIVGENNLVAGLFDSVATDAMNQVQPLVNEAQSYATSSQTSANNASSSAAGASASASGAANSATTATSASQAATTAKTGAQAAQTAAVNAQTAAQNSASNASGAEGVAYNYAILAQAWAEYMPGPIPPNILAVMNITGDHWSARWWANNASQTIQNAQAQIDAMVQNALAQIQTATTNAINQIAASVNEWYLGALTQDPAGSSFTLGCLYFNTDTGTLMVWNGQLWQPAVGVSLGQVVEYQFKPLTGTLVLTGNDINANPLRINPSQDSVSVWANGIRLLEPQDFTVQQDQVTLAKASVANAVYAVDVTATSATITSTLTVKLNVSSWVPNGVTTTFPILNASNATIIPQNASDLLFSMDGVWLEAGKDYTTAGSNITFIAPPQADSDLFGVLGVPVGGAPG